MRSTEIPEHFRDVHQVTQHSGRDVKIIPTLLFVGKVRLNKMPKVRFQIGCGAGNREQAQTLSTHGLNSNVWNGKTLPCWEFTFEITLQKAGCLLLFSAVEIGPTFSHERISSAVDAVVQMSGMSFISPNSECLHPCWSLWAPCVINGEKKLLLM